ncbi:MAG: ACP S-malonyltransferase [Trueperaceae bacterium]|nr:ACP S-malonyltransferase [Trueperaceae bacterium]
MIAALFPGQGSQTVGMAKAFYDQNEVARAVLDEAETAFPGLLELMWQGPADALQQTAHQQPALVAAAIAALAAYRDGGGTEPDYAAGHSLGEFSAYVAAGSLGVGSAVRLVHNRGRYMQDAVPEGHGAMAAVLKTDTEHVARVCTETDGVVEIANLNAPGQTVISGETAAVAAAGERLRLEKARVVPLKVSAPFHCSLMAPAAARLEPDLANTTFAAPAFPIVGNVTADVVTEDKIRDRLVEQVTEPVRWSESVLKLYDLGVRRFVEFGSGRVLSGLVKRILSDVSDYDIITVTDPESLQEAL